jgi:type III secretion protein Q
MNALPRPDEIQTADSDQTAAGTPTTAVAPAPIPEAIPLAKSAQLVRIRGDAAELTKLYSRGSLTRCIGETPWVFQWRYFTGSLTGVELHLRIAGARAVVGLETLAPFGSAAHATDTELPPGLRAPYLNGLGAALWQLLEATLQRPVEVLEVRPDSVLELTAEHLGFEVGRADGPMVRGLVCCVETDSRRRRELERVLSETSRREMPGPPLPAQLRLRWAAVLGTTGLSAGEARGLEEHDIILIDDVRAAPNMLNCRLAAGPARRHAGSLVWHSSGQLQMVQFGTGGETSMSSNVAAAPAGFDDLPVCVRFELAQWTASLAEVGNLAAGAVVDVGQRIDENAISVWVEQRCIGKGQLVAIGERLGVRLVSVFVGPAPPEAKSSDADSAARQAK